MKAICMTILLVGGAAYTAPGLHAQSRAGGRQSAPRPLTPIEVLLKLYHGTPAATSAAVKVRGVGFVLTPALEAKLVEAGADKSLLALTALRHVEPEKPAALAASIRMDPAAQARKLIRKQEAAYPAEAHGARGSVTLEIVVGQDGRVKTTRVLSGSAPFAAPALAAVQGYVYKPTILDDQAAEVTTEVTVPFEPAESAGAKN